MSDADDLQATIRRNVKVLMAISGIDTIRRLADLLGDNENHLGNRLAGRRNWQLDDIAAIAAAFNIAPALLLGDTAEIVGAAGPSEIASGSVVTGSRTKGYPWASSPQGDRLAQVIAFPRIYRPVTGSSSNRGRFGTVTDLVRSSGGTLRGIARVELHGRNWTGSVTDAHAS